MEDKKLDRIKGCLVGLAVGDALGVHLEFTPKKQVVPITDYTDGNPYDIPKGYWTDDTSMALCMGQSLIEKKGFDAVDIMTKFLQWQRKGYMSSTDECFDIGNTTRHALMEFWRSPEKGPYRGLTDVMSAGNGSIMRLAPIPMFYHKDIEQALHYAALSSKITHGFIECIDACKFLTEIIFIHINIEQPELWEEKIKKRNVYTPSVQSLIDTNYENKSRDGIEGSGYVIKSLEAAIWANDNSTSFEEAVLKAVNLGDDADTTGAVAGQIAGATYGYSEIPQHWKDGLRHHDMIVKMAEQLYEANK